MLARIIICTVFAFVGVVVLVTAGRAVWNGLRSKRWPTTRGRVLSSELDLDEDIDHPTHYAADVTYEYFAADDRHRSDVVFFGPSQFLRQSVAERAVAKYPPGKQVRVYYDPKSPQTSVLEPGVTANALALLTLGLAVATAAGLFVALGL